MFNTRYSLRQNALLLFHWSQFVTATPEFLALEAYVDHDSLVEKWVHHLRSLVASHQSRVAGQTIIGQYGVI